MQATAHSSVARRTIATISPLITIPDAAGPCPPRRVRRRCPATMLAASRTAKATGRTNSLMVSIRTIRGISAPGVPSGTRWAMLWLNCITRLYITAPNHRGRARDRVNLGCLDGVKTYGNSPIKFIKMIKKKKARGQRSVLGTILFMAALISFIR